MYSAQYAFGNFCYIKVKLRRLIRYMDIKDQRTMALKGISDDGEEEAGSEKPAQPMKKRRKICYDFLSSIDATGYNSLFYKNQTTVYV